MYKHSEFILSSTTEILETGINACAGIGEGIETYSVCDYIMQSIFLKMTGFQEQKMKFICWELASNDYEYRRGFSKTILGECSSFGEKQSIYKDLVGQIEKYGTFDINSLDKTQILSTAKTEVENLFSNSNLMYSAQYNFDEFKKIWGTIKVGDFVTDPNTLMAEINGRVSLKKIYTDHLYLHRNRIAHNSQSFQKNLPRLQSLILDNYRYENYFLWFSVLIVLDKVFIDIYKDYLEALQNKIY